MKISCTHVQQISSIRNDEIKHLKRLSTSELLLTKTKRQKYLISEQHGITNIFVKVSYICFRRIKPWNLFATPHTASGEIWKFLRSRSAGLTDAFKTSHIALLR
mmetsp:Transcript_11505/g.20795  ORF Transcript_11505/g.20795 Transcript_11505/m.20795 type:complete len:104 (-) Transcript_11505:208-519(-)